MTPIVFDFVISITAVVVGLYVLVWKLNAYTLKKYTPLLGSMIIIIGMLAWSVFALASYSAMHQSPAWVFVEGTYGSWGYSAGRGIFFFNWLLLIYYIVKDSTNKGNRVSRGDKSNRGNRVRSRRARGKYSAPNYIKL